MTIAGSDSGGGAGLAADLKTFNNLGVHGVFALTVLTAQNTQDIEVLHHMSSRDLAVQIDTTTTGFQVAATKTGMLARSGAIEVVVAAAKSGKLGRLVVDPVIVNSTGAPMFEHALIERYRTALLPLADIVTPNVAEAALLTGVAIEGRSDLFRAAEAIAELGSHAVLITGWHEDDETIDVFFEQGRLVELRAERVRTRNTRGTGCSLSAALVAHLALGSEARSAVDAGRVFVHSAISRSATWDFGSGTGPIDLRP